jgi:hypothetical protein
MIQYWKLKSLFRLSGWYGIDIHMYLNVSLSFYMSLIWWMTIHILILYKKLILYVAGISLLNVSHICIHIIIHGKMRIGVCANIDGWKYICIHMYIISSIHIKTSIQMSSQGPTGGQLIHFYKYAPEDKTESRDYGCKISEFWHIFMCMIWILMHTDRLLDSCKVYSFIWKIWK